MTLRQRIENNIAIYSFGIAISVFIAGLGAYELGIRMMNNEIVRRNSYVLKDDINSGKSEHYFTRSQLDKAVNEALAKAPKVRAEDTSVLSKKLADTNADLAECKDKAKAETDRLTSKLQAAENALSAAQSDLDNFDVHYHSGKFNVSVCIADATAAASTLGFSARRVDNIMFITQGPGAREAFHCEVECNPDVIVIVCNSQNEKISTGLITQINKYLTQGQRH